MNKKISTGFAMTLIIVAAIFVAIMVRIYAWTTNIDLDSENLKMLRVRANIKKHISSCKDHYYNGETQIKTWKVGDAKQGIVLRVSSDDMQNLPKSTENSFVVDNNFKIILTDANDDVKKSLQDSSEEHPATIIIKGYAETCDSLIPLASLDLATNSLKKNL